MRKHAWWLATLCVALAMMASLAILSVTGQAQAQSLPVTPRAGILTVLTVTNTVAAPAMETPEATASISIPLISASASPTATVAVAPTATVTAGAAVTSTLPYTSTTGVATGASSGTITVVGRGQVTVQPDIAHISLGIESLRPSFRQASSEASRSMDGVLKALRAQKIADGDIDALGPNVYLERAASGAGTGLGTASYHVSGNIDVTIRDLSQITDVLQAAVDAGANDIYGIRFGLADPSQVEAQARQAAVADALARARDLARLTGTQLGGVLSVSEVVGSQPGALANSFDQEQMDRSTAGAGSASTTPGELQMIMQLQITYAAQ